MVDIDSRIPLRLHRNAAVPSRAGVRLIVGLSVALSATLLFLVPLIWIVGASLKPEGDITSFPPTLFPHHITFAHYIDMWHRLDFPRLFGNTVIFSGCVSISALVLDSLAAYALARLEFPGRNLVFIGILATLMVPGQVTLIPLFNLLNHFGWINTYQGLIVPRAADAFGIFFLRQYFLSIPRDIEDAARIDGASELRIYRQLVLPLARPALLTLGMFLFMFNWNDLLWPLIISTDTHMQTLPAGLASFMGQHVTEYGAVSAGAVVAVLPMAVAFVVVQRSFVASVAATGLK